MVSVRLAASGVELELTEGSEMAANKDRRGDKLSVCEGARFGGSVWCDSTGEYDVEGRRGSSEYFFHRERVNHRTAETTIRCKKWKR